MLISNICGPYPVSISARTTLQQAAELMEARNVGFLVITDLDNVPLGVLTDRDIVKRAVSKDVVMSQALVANYMSQSLVTINGHDDSRLAIRKMRDHAIRRLIVVSENGTFHGVISSDDLVLSLSQEAQDIGALYFAQSGTCESHRAHDFTQMA